MIELLSTIFAVLSTLLLIVIGVELYRIDKELRHLEKIAKIKRKKR
jgi:hypothetical protein